MPREGDGPIVSGERRLPEIMLSINWTPASARTGTITQAAASELPRSISCAPLNRARQVITSAARPRVDAEVMFALSHAAAFTAGTSARPSGDPAALGAKHLAWCRTPALPKSIVDAEFLGPLLAG